jgi:serine/threonine protein kinase/lipoprotein NlpI
MAVSQGGPAWPDIDEVVEAYESALAEGRDAGIAEFAPPTEHPQWLAILCELVRVDLEHGWARGRPHRLEHYRTLFPPLFDDPDLVYAMAYEEYRLRLQAGEAPTPAEYSHEFGVGPRSWPSSPARGAASGMGRHLDTPGDGAAEQGPALGANLLSAAQAELLRTLDRTDPHAAESLAEALAGLPRVGGDFLGFQLCGELGRGAFGRVFLARQGDLADRLVALKVSADIAGESHALARLQHTNIVPIYSVHRHGPLHAVCMPYLGATTLADTVASVRRQATLPRSGEGLLNSLRSAEASEAPGQGVTQVASNGPSAPEAQDRASREETVPQGAHSPQVKRLRELGYVPAVIWLMTRVVDGLAHAHERGILHRDLKPANILFADDGEPILLDFNLALDTRAEVGAVVALVGGTLPYMAPEQLKAFQQDEAAADARSDVYALGVVLYELLSGQLPFPARTGKLDQVLPEMIADRTGPIPDVRRANPAVSQAVASIVRHCLRPDPRERYQSARELHEDLRRQLDDLPLCHAPEPSYRERLGKWARRHPRLTSSTTVAVVAALLLAAVGIGAAARQGQLRRLEAADSARRLSDELRQAGVLLGTSDADRRQVDDGVELCQQALGRYRVLDDPRWTSSHLVTSLPESDRKTLRDDIGWLLFLWSRAEARQAETAPGPEGRASKVAHALRLNGLAEGAFGPEVSPRSWCLQRAGLEEVAGRRDEARRLRARAESLPAETPRERLVSFSDRLGQMPRREALEFLQALSRHEPQHFTTWLRLGNFYVEMARLSNQSSYLDEAEHCYGVGIAMRPDIYWAYFNRGLLYLEMKDHSKALSDFDQVIALRPDLASAYINRAMARMGMADFQGAIDDLTRALDFRDAPTQALFLRSRARVALGDREGALRDRDEGLKREPSDPVSWVVRGMSKLPVDPQGALADLDSALALNPTYDRALQNKANVLSEHLGRDEEAVQVLDKAVASHPGYVKALAGRGVLLARLGRREAAIRDAQAVLAMDDSALGVYQAACVYALISKDSPADRAEALRLLAAAVRKDGSWLSVAGKDPDLDPIRDQPEFQDLLKALQVVVRTGANR